ncbi:hypothetical protein OAN47_00370 [Planctomycetota bacterium]|nr:hypothetical protein [Planctomycetota bacterium]
MRNPLDDGVNPAASFAKKTFGAHLESGSLWADARQGFQQVGMYARRI